MAGIFATSDVRAAEICAKFNCRRFATLEELGAAPDQLVAWFAWADDVGPDGEVRRTATDMYFAEVRPFEEIFRQGQGGAGEGEEEEKAGKKGSPQEKMGKLAELQKQIINATWKLRRQQGTALSVTKVPANGVPPATNPAPKKQP